MSYLENILKNNQIASELIVPELIKMLSSDRPKYCFIKNYRSCFVYGNFHFLSIMGISNNDSLHGMSDAQLCADKERVHAYINCDQYVLDTKESLKVCETVAPKYNSAIRGTMEGIIFPVFNQSNQAVMTMGITELRSTLPRVNLDIILQLSHDEINKLLVRRSYPIKLKNIQMQISRQEIHCLIELIKGKSVSEIAESLHIQQSTAKSYLNNIKSKVGAQSRFELISFIIK